MRGDFCDSELLLVTKTVFVYTLERGSVVHAYFFKKRTVIRTVNCQIYESVQQSLNNKSTTEVVSIRCAAELEDARTGAAVARELPYTSRRSLP